MQTKFKLFGLRALLRDIPQETEVGGIFLPAATTRKYVSMEVVAVGDGRMSDGSCSAIKDIVPGDVVFVQMNQIMLANGMHSVAGEKFVSLHYNDIIAKLDVKNISALTIADFHPTGRWVLARVEIPQKEGELFLPNGDKIADAAGEVKIYFEKAGVDAQAVVPLTAGQRILIEHARNTPIRLGTTLFSYIDVSGVTGVVEP